MSSLFDFGDFELDIDRYELRCAGQVLKLERIPMDILVLLVEKRDRLVTREEISATIWHDDVSIDIENGINTAVRKIRRTLKDDPIKPRFLETISGKGYRFVAQVRVRNTLESKDTFTPHPQGTGAANLHELSKLPPIQNQKWVFFAVFAVVFLCVAIVSLWSFFTRISHIRISKYTLLTSDAHDKAGAMLLTDGVRVYFGEKGPNGMTLAETPVAGGGTAIVPCPCANTTINDLSPLRSELLAGRPPGNQEGSELWVIPLLGGSPRRVGNIRATFAKWSPDERRLAFTTGRDLFIARADGSEVNKIAEVSGQTLWPRWSPDGQVLRFTENNYHNGEVWESIWEVEGDGSNLHKLLTGWNNPPHECCGVWTPDGKYFIFQSTNNGRSDLWVMPERKRWWGRNDEPALLTSGLAGGYSFPAISADGRQIFAIGSQKRGELVRYDSRLRQFVPFLGGISATWVSFSRSARSVAYIDYRDLTLWTAKADGGEKNQVTFSPFEVDGFSWSPDEKWLALRGRLPGKPWMLYLVPSKGGEPQLLLPGDAEQGIPSWSADGQKIVYGNVPPVFGEPLGTELIQILNLSSHALFKVPGSLGLWTPRWSPDGRSLSALTIVGQKLKIYDFARNRWRATKAEHVNNPTWSSDGKYIYYDTEGDNRALRRLRVSDGNVEDLASLHDYPNLSWWWSGITPDNYPLILRNLGTTEIYALSLESY